MLDFTQRWKLAEVLGALDAYGLKGKPLKRATSRHIAQHAALIERGAFMLVHADDELPRLLNRLRSPLLIGQTVQLATEAWPGLLRMLKTQLNNEAFRWISDRLSRQAAAVLQVGTAVLQRRTPGRARSGIRGLAMQLGVRVERIPELLSNCELKLPERLSKSGRRMLVVAEADFKTVRDHLKDQIAARAAQRRFGLSPARLEQLWHASMVCRRGDRYLASSIETLLHQITSRSENRTAPPEPSFERVAELPHVLRVSVARERTVEFFRALIAGVIRVKRLSEPICSAADIAVDVSDVETWLASKTASKDFVLIPQAALQLGLKQEVAYHLVRVGLLATSTRQTGRRLARVIELDEIARFQREVAPLAAIARANSVHFRYAKAWAAQIGLEMLSGPGIDGGRQLFVRAPWPP